MLKPPTILAVCDVCWEHNREASCFELRNIMYSNMHQKWLCDGCWEEHDYDDTDTDVSLPPRIEVDARDAVGSKDEIEQRLIVAMTARRLGL